MANMSGLLLKINLIVILCCTLAWVIFVMSDIDFGAPKAMCHVKAVTGEMG